MHSIPQFELELRDVARHLPDKTLAGEAFDELQRFAATGQIRVSVSPTYAVRGVRRFEVWQAERDTWISLRWWLALWQAERQEPPPSPASVRAVDVALCFPHDPEAATAVYAALARLQARGLVDVYLPAGWSVADHRRWSIWMSHHLRPPHGERVTLEAWCAEWLVDWNARHPEHPEYPGQVPDTRDAQHEGSAE